MRRITTLLLALALAAESAPAAFAQGRPDAQALLLASRRASRMLDEPVTFLEGLSELVKLLDSTRGGPPPPELLRTASRAIVAARGSWEIIGPPDALMVVSPDARRVASLGPKAPVLVFDSLEPSAPRPLAGQQVELSAGEFSTDGNLLAAIGADGAVLVWDVAASQLLGRIVPACGQTRQIRFVAGRPALALAANCGESGEVLELWELSPPRRAWSIREAEFSTAVLTTNGSALAAGGIGGEVRVYDLDTGKRSQLIRDAHNDGRRADGVLALTLSASGDFVASTGADNRAFIWQTRDGSLRCECEGHRDSYGIISVNISPDEKSVATGSADSRLRLFSAADCHMLDQINTGDRVRTLRYNGQGQLVYAGGDAGLISTADDDPFILRTEFDADDAAMGQGAVKVVGRGEEGMGTRRRLFGERLFVAVGGGRAKVWRLGQTIMSRLDLLKQNWAQRLTVGGSRGDRVAVSPGAT